MRQKKRCEAPPSATRRQAAYDWRVEQAYTFPWPFPEPLTSVPDEYGHVLSEWLAPPVVLSILQALILASNALRRCIGGRRAAWSSRETRMKQTRIAQRFVSSRDSCPSADPSGRGHAADAHQSNSSCERQDAALRLYVRLPKLRDFKATDALTSGRTALCASFRQRDISSKAPATFALGRWKGCQ